MTKQYKNIKTELKGKVFYVGLNRPEKRNAVNTETIVEIEEIFSNIPKEAKCILIYGEGKHFCAGLDLSDLKESTAIEGMLHSRKWHSAMDKVQFSSVPVIALLHGACVGGGLELASSCHIRIAEETTFYALPGGTARHFCGWRWFCTVAKIDWCFTYDRYDVDRTRLHGRRRLPNRIVTVFGGNR
ncbi:enoyl-CoA hydratase-related protein [Maribacter litopenaei]|uniref:Enoyl-CoA hydratase-related protein n=1 Tax=Maribacter litopenaei TaxID=2976127 RepID=A0ABY5Y4W1_9FLAO|nr:enoyl-CoA hydratase-related protein [Maribacter litopenaei]UWX53914.1 enoyl-CoA hydratase-related protein [Maribacter litopenaei]